MRLRTMLIILAILLLAAFAAVNWPVFSASTPLNLVVATVDAPLGLLMLGLIALLVLAFSVYMAAWQGQILLETRRHAKELEHQRVLADQAEASRFTELRGVMQEEIRVLSQRMAELHEALRTEIREQSASLAASVAEMDDRLARGGPAT